MSYYDKVQEMSRSTTFTPYGCYLGAKLLIHFHLMEKIETITWRFKE